VVPPFGASLRWGCRSFTCLGNGSLYEVRYLAQLAGRTDPAGKSNKHTTDALGNLIQVAEPNPHGGANHETYWVYKLVNKLTQTSRPRAGLRTEIRDDTMKGRWQFRT
jgi:hypothetical protein